MKDPIDKARMHSQRTTSGAVLGPFESFLLLRSLRTLSVRVKQQSKSACKLAAWLEQQPEVTRVWHPSLVSHPDHDVGTWQRKTKQ